MGRSGFQCQFVSTKYVNDHAVAGCVLGFFVGTGHVRVRDPFLPATTLTIAAPFLRMHLSAGCTGSSKSLRPPTTRSTEFRSLPRNVRSDGLKMHGCHSREM